MTTEIQGALRMRRDVLERDLKALTKGDGGSRLTRREVSFYQSRLLAVNAKLTESRAPNAKARR
jgi:hypothetical protein